MPLVFLPEQKVFFLWGDAPRGLTLEGLPAEAELVVPPGQAKVVSGRTLALRSTLPALAAVSAAALEDLPPSMALWCLASKVALDLVVRERVVPRVARSAGGTEARWGAALAAAEDAAHAVALARAMPPAAYAAPVGPGRTDVWTPEAVLREFLDAAVDAVVREEAAPPKRAKVPPWPERWAQALSSSDARFEPAGFAERSLADALADWAEPARGSRDRLRACFRLELPPAGEDRFALRYLLQSPDDPSLFVTAEEAWKTSGRKLSKLGRAFRDPQESLLRALGLAARLFPPIEASLSGPRPEHVDLDPQGAWGFLGEGAPALSEAGFGVIVPSELTAAGRRRLRLRMRVGGSPAVAGAVAGSAGLGLSSVLSFEWQAAIGDEALTRTELAALARQKSPLVRHRGVWVAVDPRELAEIRKRLAGGPGHVGAREALQGALGGEIRVGDLSAAVVATGELARVLERLQAGAPKEAPAPRGLCATLRPYQGRGLAWLRAMASLGLGACLADDMGLGKTLQVLAFLLARSHEAPGDDRPALIVAPTSVVGNWEREAARFAPELSVVRQYGPLRARRVEEIPRGAATVVLTSYALLRRDAALLAAVDWSTAVLDEAQNVKNAVAATARAARALRAEHRFALTGTPVENRLAELWSILEFANPGLLGPLETFKRQYAVPIERYGNDEAALRLRRIAGPFLLRRVKSDPAILPDLPPKNEMKVICSLTREQASLYQAVVDEEMRRISEASGIERRGRVLALLTFLKQICNHPAQYLGESGPIARRSGKLARVAEMLEEALAAGDKALVFTQYREMGELLLAHLAEALGAEVLFLHGGTPRAAREKMIRRFEEEPRGPRVFVLSMKAGGTGLNLTAASHVFHFDRWWNPAVEDQATDRAHRIGQKRAVQVHKLVCAGTVEEKIAELLEDKRALAAKVVGTGERWVTELGDAELRELFALSGDAVVTSDDAEEEAPRRRSRPRGAAR
jgi:hypothetical protein